MEIVVFGAGSLGSVLGGLLAREHAVTLVGRQPHVDAIRASGLRVTGAATARTTPAATTSGEGLAADLALVTVKAHDTGRAGRALATGEFEAVCSLSNGLGNEARLAAAVDAPVLAGTATYGAELVAPGHARCTGVGEVALGPRTGGSAPVADRAGEALSAAGIETVVASDMPRRLWTKLAVNAGINGVTALARVDNGALASDPARSAAHDAAREVARVARADGVDLPADRAIDALDAVVEATAENSSSTLQDVLAERRTEVDAINGAVVDRAAVHGIEVPVNATLAALLGTWERDRGLRGE